MALPTSGTITLAQIAAEFGGSQPYSLSQFYRGGGRVTSNNTNVPTSGLISLANFYGASAVVPGSQSWGAGTFSVTIPKYGTLTMTIRGPGGGGGGHNGESGSANQYFGGTGGTSYFSAPDGTIYAYGGTGGGNATGLTNGAAGANGSASGGNVANTVGGGNAGGAGYNFGGYSAGGKGGNGGLVTRQWVAGQPGAPVIGATYTLVVGSGGGGGGGNYAAGSAGAAGSATLSWG